MKLIHLVMREFGCIVKGTDAKVLSKDRIQIPAHTFRYLKSLISDSVSETRYNAILVLSTRDNVEVLCAQNYVGVLQTPCGIQIEILPKTYVANDHSESDEHAREILTKMLTLLQNSPFKVVHESKIMPSTMPLLELFFGYFLSLLSHLVKKGVVRDYTSLQDNQPFLKGKLIISQQIRKNLIHRERFYVSYDEYNANRPENRLIKSALVLIGRLSQSADNQKLCNEFLFMFDAIPNSKDYKKDFYSCKSDRSVSHYSDVLAWCKILLENKNPVSSIGDLPSLSILFPMERIFENYVAVSLERIYPQWKIKTQVASKYLVEEHGERKIFQLRPDLIVNDGSLLWIADTKWKLIDQTNREKKYNIKESDMYQLYAYGHKYLTDEFPRKVMLIYPKTDRFTKPLKPFIFEDNYQLEVVPFDLENDCLCM